MSITIDTALSSNTDPFGIKNYFYCKKIYYNLHKYCKESRDYDKCQDLLHKYKKFCGVTEGANVDENDLFVPA